MIIEQLRQFAVPISSLKEDPDNARLHSDENLGAIKRSLQRFGQRKPVVANRDGTVIAGNGTLRSAIALGWSEIAAVKVDDDKSTAMAYALADNRTAELAEWDWSKLNESLSELDSIDVDLRSDAGFDDYDMAAIERWASVEDGGDRTKEIAISDVEGTLVHQCPKCGFKFSREK